MTKIFLVFLGGGLGAMSRYVVTTLLAGKLGNFPLGTFAANISGSFLMGLLLGIFVGRSGATSEMFRLFLAVGFLGGFTTFSSFSAETFNLIQNEQTFAAILNVVFSVAVGLTVCAVGFYLTKNF